MAKRKNNVQKNEKRQLREGKRWPTNHSKLNDYIKKFWELTYLIDDWFIDIPVYEDRLKLFQEEWIPMIENLRGGFFYELCTNNFFREEFLIYMTNSFDYVLWFNAFLSASDQRKYGGEIDEIPFILYPFQAVLLGLSDHFSIALLKSRDIGASMTFSGKDSMRLAFSKKYEALFLSEKQDKVDIVGDRTQTLMGRTRKFLEISKLVNLKKFHTDKHLHLWRDTGCKVDGASMTSTTTNSTRYEEIRTDEFGLIKCGESFLEETAASTDRLIVFGTLKRGSDSGFRKALKSATVVDHKKLWKELYKRFTENKENFKEAWKGMAPIVKEEYKIPKKGFIKLKINFTDHPLKKGESDYLEMESNALLNDKTAIALQVWADENAGSTDRALEAADPYVHFAKDNVIYRNYADKDKWNLHTIHGGFDPGGHRHAYFLPVLTDSFGFSYVMPPEVFKGGTMINWMTKMAKEYGEKYGKKIVVTADQAITSYANEGALWSQVVRDRYVEAYMRFNAVSNRNMSDMTTAVNGILGLRKEHPITGEVLPLIIFDEANRDWVMGYELDGKYTGDAEMKLMSHPYDAFIYWCFNYYKDVLDLDMYYFGGV